MDTTSWKQFKEFLQQVRKRRGLSQERLATLMDYDRTYIWRLEKGERCHPSRKFLARLGEVIRLSPAEAQILTQFLQLAEYHPDDCENDAEDARA